MAYIIKRYSNRKLYDQQTSRYVTLDEIRQLIRSGTEVRVEDATSGDDLTSLTLTQILLENERTHQGPLPGALLHQLIKHGEAWYDFLERTLQTGVPGHWSGTPREVARFWTDWTARAGGQPETPKPQAASPMPGSPVSVNPGSPTNSTSPTSVEDELSALKEKLLSLEQRVGGRKRAAGRARPARPSARRRR